MGLNYNLVHVLRNQISKLSENRKIYDSDDEITQPERNKKMSSENLN